MFRHSCIFSTENSLLVVCVFRFFRGSFELVKVEVQCETKRIIEWILLARCRNQIREVKPEHIVFDTQTGSEKLAARPCICFHKSTRLAH